MIKPIALRPTPVFRPDHIAGDREFAGNGPQVDAWANIYPLGSKIYVNYGVTFQETGGATLFEGSDTGECADAGKEIIEILSDTEGEISFTDRDTTVNVAVGGASGLIRKARIQGDTNSGIFSGNDDPWIQLYFNPIKVSVAD